ncbi:MAG: homoserine dehydrogenase [Rhodospirillales bacterium]|nr:homoserine dehydrogenase [Rhodospirillales bacterium]
MQDQSAQERRPLKVAVAGLGTVGGGTVKLLQENAGLLAERSGRSIVITAVSDRIRLDRGFSVQGYAWFDDAVAMAAEADADLVVELIGGAEGAARKVCETAIAHGRHVVTANKALIAHHGLELAAAAEAKGVTLAYEAAVAGGIPIIKSLREGLAGNRRTRVFGILNGTCNYILTTMRESGREFEAVLAEAQALGYAEANPSFDVDGIDSAHKLAILATVAFGCTLDFAAVHVEGIRHISPVDIAFAEELGYRIKLLGIASLSDGGVERRVHPCMVPLAAPLARVDGVFNAVVADGDFVDRVVQEGRGAGERPTASAVVADIADIACGRRAATFGVPVTALRDLPELSMSRHRGCYYVRLMVLDQPGVLADVTSILRDNSVSMEAVLQRARAPGEAVPVVMTTHETVEAAMVRSLEQIAALPSSTEPPRMIRIEPF